MPVFRSSFTINASLETLAKFYKDTSALKALTPPPIIVQLHHIEPLAEGSQSEFTMWFGPLPIRWLAVHSNVHPLNGFTDTQARGPLLTWQHTHTFKALEPHTTEVTDEIHYSHHPGVRGWLTRLLFAPIGLRIMFAYRAWATRRIVKGK